MILTMTLNLSNRSNAFDPAQTGYYAHKTVLRLVNSVDPTLSSQLHDPPSETRPFSLAVMPSPAQNTCLRLAFVAENAEALAAAFSQSLKQRRLLRIGRLNCEIDSLTLGYGDIPAIATWNDLLSGQPAQRIFMHFVTTTAITKRAADGGHYMWPFPDPQSVFVGLANRWAKLGGPPLPAQLSTYLSTGGYGVAADYQLAGSSFGVPDRWQVGFVGRIEYRRLQADAACEQAVTALAKFARFMGVGYQTARGMGAVKVWLRHI